MTRPTLLHAGQVFGQLTVLARDSSRVGKAFYKCVCACGTQTSVPSSKLVQGHVVSCGHARGSARGVAKKHGHRSLSKKSPTYNTWAAMLARCNKPHHKSYSRYGAKGVYVCAEWRTFSCFLRDMGERPPGKTLDRFPDPYGPYAPDNCRWATPGEQRKNRRA